MAKWKLDTGAIIESEPSEVGNYHIFFNVLKLLGNNVHRPTQYIGKESDFTILLDDGKTIRATLIKEPKDLMEYWKHNKVEGFILDTEDRYFYILADAEASLAGISKSWSLDRQIDALNKLIEIYKE